MRHFKVLGISVIALLALATMTASAASAAVLVLMKSGEYRGPESPPVIEAAPNGTPVELYVAVRPEAAPQSEECQEASQSGTLDVNSTPKDSATLKSAPGFATCLEGGWYRAPYHVAITGVELTSKHKLALKGQVNFERYGTCVYEISKIRGGFATPGYTHGEIHGVVGKKNAKVSNMRCSKTQRFAVVWSLDYMWAGPVGPEPAWFATELR